MTSDLVCLGEFGQIEAAQVKATLAQQGIHAVMPDEYATIHGDHRAFFDLWVRSRDFERARQILGEMRQGAQARIAKGDTIPCPECGNRATTLVWQPPTQYLRWFFATLHKDVTRAKFHCPRCGNDWDTRW